MYKVILASSDDFIRYIISDSDNIVLGEFSSNIYHDNSEDLGDVIRLHINIIPKNLNNEILNLIFKKIISHYNNDLKIVLYSNNNIHNNWFGKYKGIIKLQADSYVLKKENINYDILNNWAVSIPKNNDNFTLKFYEQKNIPNEIFNEYVDLWNEFDNQTPVGDFLFKVKIPYSDFNMGNSNNELFYVILLFDKSSKLSGLSFCAIDLDENAKTNSIKRKANCIEKALTGVKEKYRGKNLGKWMISAMYNKLIEDFEFETIHTEMAPRNKYIIRINEELGYQKIIGKSREEYVFHQQDIKEMLK